MNTNNEQQQQHNKKHGKKKTYVVPVAVDRLCQPQAMQIDDMHIYSGDYPMVQRPIKRHTDRLADYIEMAPKMTLEPLETFAWKQNVQCEEGNKCNARIIYYGLSKKTLLGLLCIILKSLWILLVGELLKTLWYVEYKVLFIIRAIILLCAHAIDTQDNKKHNSSKLITLQCAAANYSTNEKRQPERKYWWANCYHGLRLWWCWVVRDGIKGNFASNPTRRVTNKKQKNWIDDTLAFWNNKKFTHLIPIERAQRRAGIHLHRSRCIILFVLSLVLCC